MTEPEIKTFYAVSTTSGPLPDVFDSVQAARNTAINRAKAKPDVNFTIYELVSCGTVRVSSEPVVTGLIFPTRPGEDPKHPRPVGFGSAQPKDI